MKSEATDALIPRTAADGRFLPALTRLLERHPNVLEVLACVPESWRDMSIATFMGVARRAAATIQQRRHLYAVETGPARTFAAISARERQVVQLIAEGLSNKEIGARLGLSDKTVKNHVSHILAKLNLRARTQIAILALRGGMQRS